MADIDTSEQHGASDKPGKGPRRKRVLIVFGAVICALVLSVLFLPKPVARYLVADRLDQMGIVHKGVDTLEIDLWNQEVKVGPLAFKGSSAAAGQIGQFSLKLNFVNLFNRRAVIDHVIVDGVDLKVLRSREGALSVNGIALQDFMTTEGGQADPATEEEPWQAALEKLQLRNSRVVLDQEGGGNLSVQIGRLDLNGFRTWEPQKPGKFDLDAVVNGVSFKWRGEARPFADKITLAIDATVNDVEISKIEKYFGSLGLERSGGSLSSRYNHEIFLHADGRIDLATKGTMEISGADIALAGQGGVGFDAAKIFVTAKISVGSDNIIDLSSGVSAVVRNLRTATPDDQSVRIGELIVEVPEFKLKGAATTLSLGASGTATLKTAVVAIPAAGEMPAVDIKIGSLSAPLDSLSFSLTDDVPRWQAAFSIAIKDLESKIAKGEAADVRLGSLKAENLRLDETFAISMKSLLLAGLNAKFSEKIMTAAQTDRTKTGAGAGQEPKQVGVRMGRFALVDRGVIQFVDASVTPSVDVKIAVDQLEVENLSTADAQQKSDLKLRAKINEFTDLDLTGWATPFATKPDFDLKLALKGLELPRFSPYVAKAVGMHMESGQLNLNAAATGKQAALDGKLDVNVRNLELGDLSPEDAKKLAGTVGMPIQTAIGLLQDSDKAINLKIPVKGSVTKPEVDLSDAIQKAVGGALTSLFPPTAIASMLISASKGGATFAPVPFPVGTAKLDSAGKTMANNLAQLLAKRPKLALRVCGRATLGDVEHYKSLIMAQQTDNKRPKPTQSIPPAAKNPAAQKPAALTVAEILQSAKNPMSKLALDRTRSLRNQLLAQNKTLEGRVSECRSAYNPKDKSPPRADVTL